MTLAILVLAATVVGGEVGPFVSWDDVTADEKHTPGSEEFYDEVDEMTVYDSGIVYRNGTVVTNVPFPAVVASMEDDSDYGWCYDVSQSIGHGESFHVGDKRRRRIRMNQFDLSWHTWTNLSQQVEVPVRYYAYGTGCVKKAISPSVFLPVSRRLDEETRAAVLASYEAYAERLYWGSKGDSNNWDESVWGRKTPGPGFKFNIDNYDFTCTNHFEYAYPTNDVRLLEHTNFVALAAAVKRMFPTYAGLYPDYMWRYDHPAWLYRNNSWITTRNCWGMWWSSSHLPKMEEQPIDDRTSYMPDPYADFTLLPVTGWTNINSLAVSDAKWACRSFTLDVFASGSGFYGQTDDMRFPCQLLLNYMDPESAPTNLPRWKTDATIPDYLTNVYVYAGMESVNKTNAFTKYLRCWDNDSHRLTPSAYAGVNQLLAVMDRTITIPYAWLVDFSNKFYRASRTGYYAGGRDPEGWWDNDGIYHVSFGIGRQTLDAVDYTNSLEVVEDRGNGQCRLEIEPTDDREPRVDINNSIAIPSADISAGYNFFSCLCQETGWDELVITQLALTDIATLEAWCVKVEDNRMVYGTGKIVVVPVGKLQPVTDPMLARLTCHATRSYQYLSVSGMEPNEGILIQPPKDAGDRVREAKYALAWMRQWGSGVSPLAKEWKFDAERDYTRNGFSTMMLRHGSEAKKDLDDLALAFYGVDYLKPDEFAPMPQTVAVTVSGDLEYAPTSYRVDSMIEYPRDYFYTKERWRGEFMVPEYFVDVTNVTACASNVVASANIAAFVREEVAPDGWRWVTEAYTNELAREILSVDATTNDETFMCISLGVTNQVTKYRWGGEMYSGIDRREWTNYLAEVTSETIENTSYSGMQTNVVVFYDEHLTVTNVTTNVTFVSWTAETTNTTARSEYIGVESREWIDYDYLAYFGYEERDDYTFLVDEFIYDNNGMAYWVCFDPMTGEMVVTMHGGVSYPLQIGNGEMTLELVTGGDPFEMSVDWPEMPKSRFSSEETFHTIHRVDWNWKSMHDKGN